MSEFNFLSNTEQTLQSIRDIIIYTKHKFFHNFATILERYNRSILKVIEIPEFQEEWNRFLKGYSELLNQFVEITIKELQQNKFTEEFQHILERIIRSSIRALSDSLDSVPFFGSITATISIIDNTLKTLNHTLELFDTASLPFVNSALHMTKEYKEKIEELERSYRIINQIIEDTLTDTITE